MIHGNRNIQSGQGHRQKCRDIPDNPHNPDRPEPNPNPGTGVAARVLLPVAMLSGSLGLILVSRRRRRS